MCIRDRHSADFSPFAPLLSYSDLLAKNCKFCPPPSHLAPSFGVTPFEFMEKLYGSWNSLPDSRRWRFGDSSLHSFWLIHSCDGETDGETALQWLRRAAFARKKRFSLCGFNADKSPVVNVLKHFANVPHAAGTHTWNSTENICTILLKNSKIEFLLHG